MAGYTPLFGSVFQGSLCGKFPDLPLWLVLLALADKNGEIDCHPSYISMVSGIPVESVTECLERFCQPDPSSRTPTDDGRRLTPLEGRGFGWHIVNHAKYREKARKMAFDQARQADGSNAERMRERRERQKDPTRPDATRANPPSYANADANANPSSLRSSSVLSNSSSSSEGVQGEVGRSKDRGREAKRAALQAAVATVAGSKRA